MTAHQNREPPMREEPTTEANRVDWVDYAKGWCIVLVVMMHSTLGVSEAMGRESWLNDFVAWARPFRMPDFFLVAGLFLYRTIDTDWRRYLDRKVLHFAYFYLLWLAIQAGPKLYLSEGGDAFAIAKGFALALIEPFGTLWFIYLLPILFVATKLLRRAPADLVLAAAALMQMAGVHTGWTVIDEFAGRYVYFFAGYAFSPVVFALAERARANHRAALAGLLVWGAVNTAAVHYGVAARPGVSLILAFAGAGAVVAFAALLAEARWLTFLRTLGARSIVIYLAFFLPMAATRSVFVATRALEDVAYVSMIVMLVALLTPLALHRLVRNTKLRFLFERPAALRLADRAAPAPTEPCARLRSV
jgi:uncharacterized membrane protein YcfT